MTFDGLVWAMKWEMLKMYTYVDIEWEIMWVKKFRLEAEKSSQSERVIREEDGTLAEQGAGL